VHEGATPLQLEARNDHTSIVRFLLQKNGDPNSNATKNPVKAVHHAAEYGHMSVVELPSVNLTPKPLYAMAKVAYHST
jgi:ankyrin repeat protein